MPSSVAFGPSHAIQTQISWLPVVGGLLVGLGARMGMAARRDTHLRAGVSAGSIVLAVLTFLTNATATWSRLRLVKQISLVAVPPAACCPLITPSTMISPVVLSFFASDLGLVSLAAPVVTMITYTLRPPWWPA